MSNTRSRQSAAWIAALICATVLAGAPAVAGLSKTAPENRARSITAQVTPVTLDPASGRQFAVWSQFDGISNQIAYARLEGKVWTDFHYLTFGRGNHTEPRVAVTRDGAYLFWIADSRRYVYAPVDLGSGRLHAVGRQVPLESGGLTVVKTRSRTNGEGGSYDPDGGMDIPVVTEECPPGSPPDCVILTPATNHDGRRQIIDEGVSNDPDGGMDIPVVTEECPPGSPPDCVILTPVPNDDGRRQIIDEGVSNDPDGGMDVPVVTEKCAPGDSGCHLLSAGNYNRRRQVLSEGRTREPDGGMDIPVVTEECPPGDHECLFASGRNNNRRRQVLDEGGADIPVVTETESLWSVTSRPTCNQMILSIPSIEKGAYHLLRFERDRLDKAGLIRLLPGSAASLPSATAGPLLDSGCF